MDIPSRIILEETAISAFVVVALIILVVMSFVFQYHWKRFGVETPLFRRMRRLHIVVSVALAVLSILLFILVLVSL